MKSLIINGSPRNGGTTSKALNAVAESLKANGGTVEMVHLGSLNISHCRACMHCKTEGKCKINDDMTLMYDKIRGSDMLIFASPVYFGAETGLFKNFLDRMYAMVTKKDGVPQADLGAVKKGSILLTCGAPDGNMTYQGVTGHLIAVFRYMGITDVSSVILPGATMENVLETEFFKEYLEALDFQMM